MRSIRGFTMVEVLTTVAILSVLSSVVYVSASSARAKGRDVKRVSDLEQLHVAIRLYAEKNGEYPCELLSNCSKQAVNLNDNPYAQTLIGIGGPMDTMLLPYLPAVPQDPLQGRLPLSDPDLPYAYYYDGYRSCGGNFRAIIYAFMETNQFQKSTNCEALSGLNVFVKDLGRSADTY